MKKELKDKWLAALRSGEYVQTKAVLEQLDENGKAVGHCCLGVLCRVAGIKATGFRPEQEYPSGDMTPKHTIFEGNMMKMLGDETTFELGMDKEMPFTLACMNDGEDDVSPPQSFAQIADYIEHNVPVDA